MLGAILPQVAQLEQGRGPGDISGNHFTGTLGIIAPRVSVTKISSVINSILEIGTELITIWRSAFTFD